MDAVYEFEEQGTVRENRLFCHVPATSINSVALLAGRDDFAVHYKMDPGDQAILLFPVRRKRLPIRCSPVLPPVLPWSIAVSSLSKT